MHKAFSARTEAEPAALYDVVADLATYPHWLDVVSAAAPTGEAETWSVTLRARIGPLARSKRLRMVRVLHEPPVDGTARVRFERTEVDGRNHAEWAMAATVSAADPADDGMRSEILLELRYRGSLWSGLLEGVLDAAAERATARLQDYVRA